MAYRWFVADLLTGSNLVDLPAVDSGSTFGVPLNGPEQIRCDINMQASAARDFDVAAYTMPGRVVMGVADGPHVLAAGPVWRRRWDSDSGKVTLSGAGMWSYFDHRFALLAIAATASVSDFTVVDATDSKRTRTAPNPALQIQIAGVSIGTYAKRVVEIAMQHTGGNVPVVLPSEEWGSFGRVIDALDFESVGRILRDVTELEDGVDIRFRPRFTSEGDGIEWEFLHGSKAKPLLGGSVPHHWDFTAPEPAAAGLMIEEAADELASRVWATGGRSADKVLVARRTSQRLLDVGFALFEQLDTSHGSIDRQDMLDRYVGEALKLGDGPIETWSFEANRDRRPLPGTYEVGDAARLTFAKFDPDSRRGDPFLRHGGTFDRRIVQLEGQQGKKTITVSCAPSKE